MSNPETAVRFPILGRLELEVCAFLSRNLPFERGRWRAEALAVQLAGRHNPLGARRTIRTRHGFSLEVDPQDEIGRVLFTRGEWEPTCSRVVLRILNRGDVFIDVGAHIGYYSLLGSRRVGPSGRVLCFEPVEANRGRLNSNLLLNRAQNCTVYAEALWSRTGQLRLNLVPGNSGMATVRPLGSVNPSRTETTRALRFDDRFPDLTNVKLVKMDVEGAEYEVLRGMERLLRREAPDLIVEVAAAFQHQVGRSVPELCAYLHAFGYRMYALEWGGSIRPVDASYAEAAGQFEALFTVGDEPAPLRHGTRRSWPSRGRGLRQEAR